MSDANLTGDNADLEALFDSIASTRTAPASPAPAAAPAPTTSAIGDSDDLQALFDSVASTAAAPSMEVGTVEVLEAEEDESTEQERVFKRIGHMKIELL